MKKPKATSERSICEGFLEDRDVQGLLEFIQARRLPLAASFSLSMLSRCIRAKARDDLSGLSEDLFAAILALGMTMLCRCQLFIEKRLSEVDETGGNSSAPIPADLIDGRWLERAERISRFCAEMAALRARVSHLNGMDHDRLESDESTPRPRLVPAMEEGEAEAGGGAKAPRSRRKRA